VRYVLVGHGKMGRAVDEAAAGRGHARGAVVTRGGRVAGALRGTDVAFEFTRPEAAQANVIALLAAGVSVVCGTTGWDANATPVAKALRGSGAALVVAPNFSLGMGLFFRIVEQAARTLAAAQAYDAYVIEQHHRAKRDAPSGTALRLAALVEQADPRVRSVLAGAFEGPLPAGALHVVGVRAGFEEGTHTVGFDGPHDSIQLEHRARGRAGAALGAVLAAEWVQGRRGRYSFEDVLDGLLSKPGQREPRTTRTRAKRGTKR
jgi:4-hydroxy-tetrahydrodipicolinate reductase